MALVQWGSVRYADQGWIRYCRHGWRADYIHTDGHVENLSWGKARYDQFPDHRVRAPWPILRSDNAGSNQRYGSSSRMSNEAPDQTLQPTALVHEAWLRLAGEDNPKFQRRAHLFGAAAEAMRRILIENARRKRGQRHGGGQQRVDF